MLALLLAAPAARADEAKPPTLLLGLGAGAYIPTSRLGPSFLVGIDAAVQLPLLERKLGIGAGLGYSQPTTSGTIEDSRVPGASADYSSTMRELLLDVRLSFRILSWQRRWSPHVGIGPSFYFLSHKVTSLALTQSETSTQVGFLFVAGADLALGPGAVVGEIRIPFATVGQRTTGESNVGAISILVGYRFRI
jgi:opacity protein-like surface antigen